MSAPNPSQRSSLMGHGLNMSGAGAGAGAVPGAPTTAAMTPQQQRFLLGVQQKQQFVNRQKTNNNEVLSAKRLQDLVATIDPSEKLDADVENLLLEIADDFIDDVASFACSLAKHRKSTSLDVKDVQMYLEHNWNIRVPGYTSDSVNIPHRTNLLHSRSRLANYKSIASVTGSTTASASRKRKAAD